MKMDLLMVSTILPSPSQEETGIYLCYVHAHLILFPSLWNIQYLASSEL